jgi:aminoglycoside N3'-acetyltransferase
MAPDRVTELDAVLDDLCVPFGRVLYVQSSMDWLQRAGFTANDVMAALRRRTDAGGTLVMPSYPSTLPHAEYLSTRPTFDVRRTGTVSGLLAEMLRRTGGASRSLDPDFPVCALGADALSITGGVPDDADPFGAHSPYQRMLDRRAILVGLGVSLNTTSFVHVIDSRAAASYPTPAYEPVPFETTVVDAEGRTHVVKRQALRSAFQKLTAPSAIIDVMKPGAEVFTTIDLSGVRFFRWDLDAWATWCLAHARARASAGAWPCWLSRLADAA